jgi:phosphoglycerate dehydrogenase-like enzyme
MKQAFDEANKLHLHIDNDRALGPVFEVTKQRLQEAMDKYPDVAKRLKVTIDYDCQDFEKHIAGADALLCWKFKLANIAQRAPRLRWIHVSGAGIEYFTPFDWMPDNITFINNRGVHGARANEYAIMAVLMLNNRLPEMTTSQREGQWNQVFNSAISGKTLLVIGVGSVGGGVAKWAKQFDMNVIGVRRSKKSHAAVDEMYGPEDISKLIPRADFIIVTAPATHATQNLIGKDEIELMRPGAGIINYSRAHVVDYDALRVRLENREISAILDVFDPEPLSAESPLWSVPNLIITPHCSSDDTDSYIPMTLDLMFRNIRRIFEGEPVLNSVDPTNEY